MGGTAVGTFPKTGKVTAAVTQKGPMFTCRDQRNGQLKVQHVQAHRCGQLSLTLGRERCMSLECSFFTAERQHSPAGAAGRAVDAFVTAALPGTAVKFPEATADPPRKHI